MKPQRNKLIQREQEQEHQTQQQSSEHQQTLEFSTAEDAIRFDAANTEVPSSIGERLRHSVASEPPPARSWWRRLFDK